MTTTPQEPLPEHDTNPDQDAPDQDAEPSTPTGDEPDTSQLHEETAEPASDPDPDLS